MGVLQWYSIFLFSLLITDQFFLQLYKLKLLYEITKFEYFNLFFCIILNRFYRTKDEQTV